MRKKTMKYLVGIAILFLLAYNSVYFRKLDQLKVASVSDKFNAVDYSQKLWTAQMGNAIANAIDIKSLDSLLKTNPEAAFSNYGNSLSIGNYRYFLVKMNGVITSVNEDDATMEVETANGTMKASIATEFIYGNTIRDASKLVAVKDFSNSKDLNDISSELNSIAKKTVIAPFKSKVKTGDHVEAVGAIEINKEHVHLDGVELVPVQLKIIR